MYVLFLLASIGVVNGVLVGGYLVIGKQNPTTDRYFGGLLLALSIRIGKSVFFYFSQEVDQLILQIGLSACVFIGPFFYLYIKSLRQPEPNFKREDALLLLVLLVLITSVGVAFPYPSFPEIWNGYIIYGIYTIWISYTLLGSYHFWRLMNEELYAQKMKRNHRYMLAIVFAMLSITATYSVALFVGITYIWGALIFSLTFYYLMARMLLTRKPVIPKALTLPLVNGAELLGQINELMISEKPFVNQGLKLDDLAAKIDVSKNTLSRVLNEEYTQGFSQYIKEFRINEAKQLIASRPELSLEGIGYEAGFSSKSAFFEAFKKIVDCTPAEYKKSVDQ